MLLNDECSCLSVIYLRLFRYDSCCILLFQGNCIHCQDGVDCQTMGYYANEHPGEGTFYTETTEEYPFCKASEAEP